MDKERYLLNSAILSIVSGSFLNKDGSTVLTGTLLMGGQRIKNTNQITGPDGSGVLVIDGADSTGSNGGPIELQGGDAIVGGGNGGDIRLFGGSNTAVGASGGFVLAHGAPSASEVPADGGALDLYGGSPGGAGQPGDVNLQGAGGRIKEFGSLIRKAGSGSPEGAVTAPVGSTYVQTDGSAGFLWEKATGSGNTGWVKSQDIPTPKRMGAKGDNSTDDRTILFNTNALATHKLLTGGTYKVNSALTLTGSWAFTNGSILKPASGVAITINCDILAGNFPLFDLSLGGTVAIDKRCPVGQFNVRWLGAKGDGASATGAAITAGSTTLTTTGGTAFSSTLDVGKTIVIPDAGAATMLTVSSYDNATEIITTSAPHGFVSAGPVRYKANGGSIGGLTTGTIYYAAVLSTTTLALYSTITDAMAGAKLGISAWTTNKLNLTGTISGSPQLGIPIAKIATITAVTSAGQITISSAASETVSGKRVTFGTPDDAPIAAAINAILAAFPGPYLNGFPSKKLIFPAGIFCVTSAISGQQKYGMSIIGDGRSSTTIAYLGAPGGTVLNLTSIAYADFRDFSVDCNSSAKYGFYMVDDETAVAGVTVQNAVRDIQIRDCTDPTGWGMYIGTPPGVAWQVSEHQIGDIYFDGCFNGLKIIGSQTIGIRTGSIIVTLAAGGVGLSLETCRTTLIGYYSAANLFSKGIEVISPSVTSCEVCGFYFDGITSGCMPLDVSGPSTSINDSSFKFSNGDISWSGTVANEVIVRVQGGQVQFNGVVIRSTDPAPTTGCKAKIEIKHAAEGMGGKVFAFGNLKLQNWAAGALVGDFGAFTEYDLLIATIGGFRRYVRRTSSRSSGSDTYPLTLSRVTTGASGATRNGLVFTVTGDPITGDLVREGAIEPKDTSAGTMQLKTASDAAAFEWTDTTLGTVARAVGANGATGYQHPLALGTISKWIDSFGNERRVDGLPASDLAGQLVTPGNEFPGLMNRIATSEGDLSPYFAAGTVGQADPWGTTRAARFTGDNSSALFFMTFSQTGLGSKITYSFFAKAGTATSMLVGMYDTTSSGYLNPSTGVIDGSRPTILLDSTWRRYKVTFANYNLAHAFFFSLTPAVGTVYLTGFQASDNDTEYLRTLGTAVTTSIIHKRVANVKEWGARGDGTTNDTAAILAAANSGLPVYIPDGVYSITELDLSAIVGLKMYGDRWGNPRRYLETPIGVTFSSAITNGHAVIKLGDQFHLENITINGTTLGFATQNAIGLDMSNCHNWTLDNVAVSTFATGIKATNGWLGTAKNVYVNSCGVGLVGTQLNDTQWILHMENCLQAFDISNTSGITLNGEAEGGNAVTTAVFNGVYAARGVFYFELAGVSINAPFLDIGPTSFCYGIEMTFWALSSVAGNEGVPSIRVTRQIGGRISVYGTGPVNKRNHLAINEAYCEGVEREVYDLSGNNYRLPMPADAGAGLAMNWLPDPYYLNLWPVLTLTNCTNGTTYNELPQDWRGSLTLTATSGSAATAYAVQTVLLSDYPYLIGIGDQKCVFAYFIKVDAGNTFFTNGSPGPYAYIKALPSGQVSASDTRSFVIGEWRLVFGEVLVPSGTTSFEIYRHVNPTGVAATASTVARFGPVLLVPAGYSAPRAIMRKIAAGQFTHHPLALAPKRRYTSYLQGTAYTLVVAGGSPTDNQVTGGSGYPFIVFDKAGTYRITCRAKISYAAATVVAETVTVKLARYNNTPGDVAEGTVVVKPRPETTATHDWGMVEIDVIYTTNIFSDILILRAYVSAALGAGSMTISAASMIVKEE